MTSDNRILERTKPVIIDLVNQCLSAKELAEELNQRQLYMSSGASWNAGRINLFLAKHAIKPSRREAA
jgi:hypothetical protein